jgi:hypothetical protein
MQHAGHKKATALLEESSPATGWNAFFAQTIKTCEHDESNLLCESVSRALWGDESFAELLRFKVLQELEGNGEWYQQRVGQVLYNSSVQSIRHQLGLSVHEADEENGGKKKKAGKAKKEGGLLSIKKGGKEKSGNVEVELQVLLLNAKNLSGSSGFAVSSGITHCHRSWYSLCVPPQDPMCTLEVGKQKFRSTTKSKTNSPKWNEAFKFRLPRLCASLAHSPLKVSVVGSKCSVWSRSMHLLTCISHSLMLHLEPNHQVSILDVGKLLSTDLIGTIEINQADLRPGVVWRDAHPLGRSIKGDTKGVGA